MILEYKYLNYMKNRLEGGMRLVPQLWLAVGLLSNLALASEARGDAGPLTIESIECRGNEKTSCDYILSQTTLRTGDVLEDEKVRESQMRLELVGYFDQVEIELAKGSEVGKTQVTISLHERSGYSFNFSATGVAFSSDLLGVGDLSVINQNITGHGDALSLRVRTAQYQTSQLYLSRLEYTRSAFIFPRAYLALGLAGALSRYSPAPGPGLTMPLGIFIRHLVRLGAYGAMSPWATKSSIILSSHSAIETIIRPELPPVFFCRGGGTRKITLIFRRKDRG
jgi:hypothetical protein